MKLIILLTLLNSLSYANQSNPKIFCSFDQRKIEINLNDRLDLNSKKAIKANFYYNENHFGHCLLVIKSEFQKNRSKASFDQILFEVFECKFSSEKRSADLNFVTKGMINFTLNGPNAYLNIFKNKDVLNCHSIKN